MRSASSSLHSNLSSVKHFCPFNKIITSCRVTVKSMPRKQHKSDNKSIPNPITILLRTCVCSTVKSRKGAKISEPGKLHSTPLVLPRRFLVLLERKDHAQYYNFSIYQRSDQNAFNWPETSYEKLEYSHSHEPIVALWQETLIGRACMTS